MDDLKAFLVIARLNSFTKAAAELGVSPSALSHLIKSLEKKLGVRLFARTTRSIAPTDAGQRLINDLAPLFEQVDDAIQRLGELRDKPAGHLRITGADDAIEYILRPVLPRFLSRYPDISVEVSIDYGFTDIVKERFDAGIRLGEDLNNDMIAVKVSPNWRQVVVASPQYLRKHSVPKIPEDLLKHNCINIRYSEKSGLYAWEFEKGDKKLNLKVKGQFTANTNSHVLNAVLDGMGIAYLPEYYVEEYLKQEQLVTLMLDWCPYFEGYYLYYPYRRQDSPAFMALLDMLRYEA
ncbi:LysR family transcriptional regulator [Shewanella mangrovi]|uniref:LysR family transcriptional regulator n=1 Tax=Shewanella mangrovi TaxID=1515746 RepID=A0A094JEM2_9GAMM|nr:LysR family transcriptional regulator [Shewanella mangrovi]KFZ36489.1 LysR family transcriptional regulator [Shewanella mangrovi]